MHGYSLSAAILFEITGSTAMKLSNGLSRLEPTLLMFGSYTVAFACNAMALRTLDLSVTDAIWSGLGTARVAAIGMTWFREPVTALRLISIALIVTGVIGLAFSGRTAG